MAAPPDGSFHLLWIDSTEGKGIMESARIEVDEKPDR